MQKVQGAQIYLLILWENIKTKMIMIQPTMTRDHIRHGSNLLLLLAGSDASRTQAAAPLPVSSTEQARTHHLLQQPSTRPP
jgi:hypothetical protein